MQCEMVADEALRGDKLDVLYGEADVAARERVQRAPRRLRRRAATSWRRFAALRRDLAGWRAAPGAAGRRAPRGFVVPRWLAGGGARSLLAFGATLGVSGYLSLRQRARRRSRRARTRVERQQQRVARALQTSLGSRAGLRDGHAGAPRPASTPGIDERLRVEPGAAAPSASSAGSPTGRSAPTCGAASTWRRSRPA